MGTTYNFTCTYMVSKLFSHLLKHILRYSGSSFFNKRTAKVSVKGDANKNKNKKRVNTKWFQEIFDQFDVLFVFTGVSTPRLSI